MAPLILLQNAVKIFRNRATGLCWEFGSIPDIGNGQKIPVYHLHDFYFLLSYQSRYLQHHGINFCSVEGPCSRATRSIPSKLSCRTGSLRMLRLLGLLGCQESPGSQSIPSTRARAAHRGEL